MVTEKLGPTNRFAQVGILRRVRQILPRSRTQPPETEVDADLMAVSVPRHPGRKVQVRQVVRRLEVGLARHQGQSVQWKV